jgi:lauroyl/myristoyl acyltransferase
LSLANTCYRVLRSLCRSIPPELAEPLLKKLSWAYYQLDKKNKVNVQRNLKVLRPQQNRDELEKAVYLNFAFFLYEFFSGSMGTYQDENSLKKKVREQLGEPNEQGTLLLIPHCGNWELTLRQLLSMGYTVTTVIMPHSHEDVNTFFHELRYHPNLETASLGNGMRACLRALSQKRIVALACERDYTGQGIELDMFGQQISFPKGPAWLMLRKQPPTFFVSCQRIKLNHFKVELIPMSLPEELPQNKEEAVYLTSQSIAQRVFQNIDENPEQWITFDHVFSPKKSATVPSS